MDLPNNHKGYRHLKPSDCIKEILLKCSECIEGTMIYQPCDKIINLVLKNTGKYIERVVLLHGYNSKIYSCFYEEDAFFLSLLVDDFAIIPDESTSL